MVVAAKGLGPKLATQPAALDAAKGRSERRNVAVDADGAGLYLPGNAARALLIGAPHRSAETVFRIVGDAHCLGIALVRDHGQDRTENLLPPHVRLLVYIREHPRLHQPPAADP